MSHPFKPVSGDYSNVVPALDLRETGDLSPNLHRIFYNQQGTMKSHTAIAHGLKLKTYEALKRLLFIDFSTKGPYYQAVVNLSRKVQEFVFNILKKDCFKNRQRLLQVYLCLKSDFDWFDCDAMRNAYVQAKNTGFSIPEEHQMILNADKLQLDLDSKALVYSLPSLAMIPANDSRKFEMFCKYIKTYRDIMFPGRELAVMLGSMLGEKKGYPSTFEVDAGETMIDVTSNPDLYAALNTIILLLERDETDLVVNDHPYCGMSQIHTPRDGLDHPPRESNDTIVKLVILKQLQDSGASWIGHYTVIETIWAETNIRMIEEAKAGYRVTGPFVPHNGRWEVVSADVVWKLADKKR